MSSFVTRAERSGSIFFRVTGLIRSGQLQWSDRPLWYDVYAACPPLTPPDWNVKLPKHDEPVRKLFYKEDEVRAAFYKKYRLAGIINISSDELSPSQLFINEFNRLKEEETNKDKTFEEMFALTEACLKEAGLDLK